MLTKLRTLISLYRELGFRWSAFRVAYAFRRRAGFIRLQMPQYKWEDRPLETWLKKEIPSTPEKYAQWRKRNSPPFFHAERSASVVEARLPAKPPWNPQTAIDEADRVLNGELKYFAHDWVKTGFPPNWHKDYFSNAILSAGEGPLPSSPETLRSQGTLAQSDLVVLDSTKHWSQISDDASSDIKFIWEPNRFAFVYTLVRAYAASHDEKYPEAFWALIHFWEKYNPPNTARSWMDGQEIALRLMAWIFGYHAFIDSPSSTPERKAQFTLYIAAQTERIYKNIGYAISTRSNHTISEALGLWLVGLLFPELKDSERYSSLGRKLLEQEAAGQIFPDGTYSMYALNYHRFILHIYLYAIRLGEINHSPFSTQLINSVTQSIEYLSHLIDRQSGQMPVYGSNDGALVLPLNNCDFTDYRPLLQLGWYATKKEFLFEPGPWDEDVFWLFGISRADHSAGVVKAQNRKIAFPHGGTYLLRGHNSKAIIRCTDYTSRPSHADQLHVDVWIHGHNIAVDAGTYLYSGEGIWRNGLAHTSAHNTVTVDNEDQMTMISRFTWTNWSKGTVLQHNEKIWQGTQDGYKPVAHQRTVLALDQNRWVVVDHLHAKESHQYALHWLLCDGKFGVQELAPVHGLLLQPAKWDSKPLQAHELSDSNFLIQMGSVEGNGKFSIVRADPNSTRGWRSRYYGHKEPAISVKLEANQLQVTFWSFFGFENDVMALEGSELRINSHVINLDNVSF